MDRTIDIRQSRSAVVLRVLTLRVLLTLEYNIVRTQHWQRGLTVYHKFWTTIQQCYSSKKGRFWAILKVSFRR